MPLVSRAVVAVSRNRAESYLQTCNCYGLSKRFFSSMSRRSAPSNLLPHSFTEQTMVADHESLKCFTKYGLPKRYYSSRTYSTSNLSTSSPSPEQAGSIWKSLLIPGIALAGVGGLFLLIHHNDQKRAVLKGKGEKFERSAIQGPIIGGPFSLIDTEGRLVTEKNLLGNWVLMYFGYTSSPDVGPAEVRKMASTVNILESKQNIKVSPIFITIDPQRDTPSHLRAYIQEFDSKIVGLTGPVGAIRQMAQEYRVFFRKIDEDGDEYLIESSHNMYLMNPNMEVTRSFGIEYNAEELSEAVAKEIKKTASAEPHS